MKYETEIIKQEGVAKFLKMKIKEFAASHYTTEELGLSILVEGSFFDWRKNRLMLEGRSDEGTCWGDYISEEKAREMLKEAYGVRYNEIMLREFLEAGGID